jgi:hypothetical protein
MRLAPVYIIGPAVCQLPRRPVPVSDGNRNDNGNTGRSASVGGCAERDRGNEQRIWDQHGTTFQIDRFMGLSIIARILAGDKPAGASGQGPGAGNAEVSRQAPPEVPVRSLPLAASPGRRAVPLARSAACFDVVIRRKDCFCTLLSRILCRFPLVFLEYRWNSRMVRFSQGLGWPLRIAE